MRNYFIKVSKHIENKNKNQKKYFKKNQNQKKNKNKFFKNQNEIIKT